MPPRTLDSPDKDSLKPLVHQHSLFTDPAAYDNWEATWRQRFAEDGDTPAERRASMRAAKLAVIPRNHLVEEALSAAESNNDLSAFETLLAVLSAPYDEQPVFRCYAEPPRPDQIVHRTFCGTRPTGGSVDGHARPNDTTSVEFRISRSAKKGPRDHGSPRIGACAIFQGLLVALTVSLPLTRRRGALLTVISTSCPKALRKRNSWSLEKP